MNKISFFDLKRIYERHAREVSEAALRALSSGRYVLGPETEGFENRCWEFLSPSSAERPSRFVSCNSGTDALILALLALDIKSGDEVITPSHTAIPTICAIRAVGATPIFCDIDAKSWLMDVSIVPSLLTARTKAVIAVHLYGNMVDIQELRAKLDQSSTYIPIIEDVAQAFGAKQNNRMAGTLADLGAYSFYPTKNLGALGDGGGIAASNESLLESIRLLRFYGQKDRYHAIKPRGLNSRLDEIQAAILSSKLPLLATALKARTNYSNLYRSRLDGLPIEFQKITRNTEPAWHLSVIRLESEDVRNSLQSFLLESGIETIIHYPHPTHTQPAFKDFCSSTLLKTETLAKTILSLPMNEGLTVDEIETVADRIIQFFKAH